jgi:hypothetical protein
MRAGKKQSDIRQKVSLSRARDTALAGRDWAMKGGKTVRAIAGLLLIAGGYWLAVPTPYKEQRLLIDADGCRIETDIVEK